MSYRCSRLFVMGQRSLTLAPSISCYVHTTRLNKMSRRPSSGRGQNFTAGQTGTRRKRIAGIPADRGGYAIEDIVRPRTVIPSHTTVVGTEEWTSDLDSSSMSMALDKFFRRSAVREQAMENGLTHKLFVIAYRSFRSYCLNEQGGVEPALLVLFQDIIKEGHDVDRLYPFFIAHARKVFPHLEAMDDLRMISDLTEPHNWYPIARTVHRKIIFHAGPTNSGKTFQALKRFAEAKSGIYCGPLKLLASEIFIRSNESGLKCDLVTGEERRFAIDNYNPVSHISSTVEMLSMELKVEVAVIDEIQMLRDDQRGWAWTRALLGVAADEVHLCGEVAAIDIVKKILDPIGEHVEVRYYERKGSLSIADQGLGSLDNIQPGDCIVCFGRKKIYAVTKHLEKLGIKPAVIYGDLPPGTKLAQAAKFNDENDPCNILVSTDAIGMGLNLNIGRVIFSSCTRQGELIPNYAALQIAGRAGRFGSTFSNGIVTTLRKEDISVMKSILEQPIESIKSAGIAPTFEQIETFSFHLPQASFVHLLDLFVSVCSISENYFICTVEQIRSLADLIDYIPLPLKVRYTFCVAPISVESKVTSSAFIKMVRRFSTGQCITFDWLMDILSWSPEPAKNFQELENLERTYDVLDLYLWISLRYPDMLPDEDAVREASRQLDALIQQSVEKIDLFKENQKKNGLITKASPPNVEKVMSDRISSNGNERKPKLPDKRKGKRKSAAEVIPIGEGKQLSDEKSST